MTVASFLRYDNAFSENVKPDDEKNLKKDDLRSSVRDYTLEEQNDIVAVLKPMVGVVLTRTDQEYKAYLDKLDIVVSEREAHAFAVMAMRENDAERRARSADRRKKSLAEGKKQREMYLYEAFPFYRAAVEKLTISALLGECFSLINYFSTGAQYVHIQKNHPRISFCSNFFVRRLQQSCSRHHNKRRQ